MLFMFFDHSICYGGITALTFELLLFTYITNIS